MQCLHNCAIIFKGEGEYIIVNVSNDTKYFINQYGLFYEGQRLFKFCQSNNHMYFDKIVIIDKFIVHYDKIYRNKQNLYFRFYPEGKNSKYYKYTISCEQLGIFFRKSIDK